MKEQHPAEPHYLTCERNWVYFTLIAVAGFWGAYTYLLRGNVFCNAQTGNVVLMGLALGSAEWAKAGYYLVPISAYILGAFVSELMLIEMIAVLGLGFLPETAPVQICQVVINFVASMQYNTFRQAEGVPVATTFATNHIRQIGVGLAKELRHRHSADKSHRRKLARHCGMLFFFILGAVTGTVFCHLLVGRAIWLTMIPLGIIFLTLLHADRTTEKELVEQKPAGH
ncbi:YoaK family protein [Gemmiger formicilis]|uniref:YoaK family protein n=1 Tax=Gemmiger formicilis TaxID=745368 RepID=UPI003A956C1C